MSTAVNKQLLILYNYEYKWFVFCWNFISQILASVRTTGLSASLLILHLANLLSSQQIVPEVVVVLACTTLLHIVKTLIEFLSRTSMPTAMDLGG